MNTRSTSQQQQPAGDRLAQQQQMAGSNEFQNQGQQGQGQQGQPAQQQGADKPQQMGEGSYEGAREYKERTERFVKNADVDAEAEKAKPRSEQEAREMKQAEEEGKSHSKGED